MASTSTGLNIHQLSEKEVKKAAVASNPSEDADVEIGKKDVVPVEFGEVKDLRRGLHQRHIQMISLAGTIGTGLFLSSGSALAHGGPAGAFIGYTIMGVLVSGVIISIAELSALVPLSGGAIRHAEYFVDPALSFAYGWNYVYSCLVSVPAEIVAAAVIVEFWISLNNAIWISVFGVILFASNIFFVRIYGELEFFFATLKIMLVVGMNIMALIITCGGGPDHVRYGFKFWHDPGPFVQYLNYPGSLGRFMGFWYVFSNAAYAYSGIENISIAASETKAPRRNIPKAAKRIFWRVVLFYVISIFMVTLLVPSSDPALLSSTGTASESPFVIAAKNAKISAVPSIINFVVLTSAWSSGNSTMLSGSRVMFAIAHEGHAPKFLTRTSRWGIPYIAITIMGIFIALGYMTLNTSASTVFTWLQDLISASTMVGWIIISIVYLRMYYAMKKQGISRDELPWKGPFQPFAAWMSLISFTIILLTSGYRVFLHGHWDTETFISCYLDIGIIFALYFGYKFAKKTNIIPLSEIPVRRFIDIAKQHPDPPESPKKGWQKLNLLWS
ncbi:hypothetical protein ASPWEDRAFT_48024 [Aspergillus wentii DTO 134E9]|uniref:Amino acid permease/ SLC12A domain-containing protein n=1 Tax=Aspergillus wentii DTO 134E9 TaxID=1073089 RepID=A0A1L9S2T5_ASPWE|nr:uncharacterized protein ASPWEDRAFT_48024 [Aspergillus wentii DTO 134E9]OJJ41447.1 hypothetical protein ASPWEDRAFT_48024 [Aspergillus wentii DTO 134E9]